MILTICNMIKDFLLSSEPDCYVAPECSELELNADSVLCLSGNLDDYDVIDGWS